MANPNLLAATCKKWDEYLEKKYDEWQNALD